MESFYHSVQIDTLCRWNRLLCTKVKVEFCNKWILSMTSAFGFQSLGLDSLLAHHLALLLENCHMVVAQLEQGREKYSSFLLNPFMLLLNQ